MNDRESTRVGNQPLVSPSTRIHAKTKVTVQSSDATPYDKTANPALIQLHIRETFSGDIEGESTVWALQSLNEDKSATMVTMQRVCGKLGGRQGTFVLQDSETIENGKIKAKWFCRSRIRDS